MAADKQYADALKALEFIECNFLPNGKCTTYGAVCEAIGYKPSEYARHAGQVCSLIDSACFWAKLPFISLEKVRKDSGEHNLDSFQGEWNPVKATLIENASAHEWTVTDIARIRSYLQNHMNGEGALAQWKRIISLGEDARIRATTYR